MNFEFLKSPFALPGFIVLCVIFLGIMIRQMSKSTAPHITQREETPGNPTNMTPTPSEPPAPTRPRKDLQ